MKMNIKGLVFVGFAAAVFASAANAASDKIVTSKSYVDAKISNAATISSSSTTTAPNEKAVYDALGTKQNIHISDNDADHGKTLIVGNNGNITISDVTATGQQQADWDEDDTTAPSYIQNKPGVFSTTAAGLAPQADSDATKVLNAGGNWSTNDTTTVATGNANGKIAVTHNGTTEQVSVYGLQDAAYKTAETTISTIEADNTDAEVPTAKAVYDFVNGQIDAAEYEAGAGINITDQTVTNTGVRAVTASDATTGTDGTISVNTNGTVVEVAVKGLQGAAYKTAETAIDSTTPANNTDTEVPTAKAVYDFVTAQTGDVLPDNPTGDNACSTTNPCALVWDGSATGPEWKRIEQ